MRLVVDTNVVFSALIAGGVTREILLTGEHGFFAPEHFFAEFRGNQAAVRSKTGLSESELDLLLHLLFERIRIVPRIEFEDNVTEAEDAIGAADPDDVPFLALAMHVNAEVWSDDEHFQQQDAVRVWRTHELVDR